MTPIHVDESLLVLDKPAGLLSVPGRTEPDCLALRAQALWPDAQVVHRLDQATSGLMLFARGATLQRRLSADFAARRVHKRYEAIVRGLVDGEVGEIDLPIGADWPRRPMQRIDLEAGKPSLTRWRVLSRDPAAGTTRIELEPITGRTHQLRVHLRAIGHIIVGDTLYGGGDGGDGGDAALRLHLHATQLTLSHPADARAMSFNSAAPF